MENAVAILVPCYRRPEYTRKCLDSLLANTWETYPFPVRFHLVDDGSNDGTNKILTEHPIHEKYCARVYTHPEPWGLRRTILEFFKEISDTNFRFISKVDNDCTVPPDWLMRIVKTFDAHPELDIASPNVYPSHAAFTYGKKVEGLQYMPTKIIGGVWTMKHDLIRDMVFEDYPADGIGGAISILRQIRIEKGPIMGWLPEITFQDIGHHSGDHPDHIKTQEHFIYSQEVGRPVAWTPNQEKT